MDSEYEIGISALSFHCAIVCFKTYALKITHRIRARLILYIINHTIYTGGA